MHVGDTLLPVALRDRSAMDAGMLWLTVAAQCLFAAAYGSILIIMARFVRPRVKAWHWLMGLFGLTVIAGIVGHVLGSWMVGAPGDGLLAFNETISAFNTCAVALALGLAIPRELSERREFRRLDEELREEALSRRTMEDHLADAEQSLAVTLASVGAGLISLDRAGRVTGMNGVAEQITGWREAEARGKSGWDVFVRADRPVAFRESTPVEVMIREGYDVASTHHIVLLSRTGNRTSVEVKADLTHARNGEVRGMIWIFRDATRLAEAATETSRLAAIVESSHDAIIGITLDGRIRSWNQGARALFGYPAEEAVGQRIQMLIPPDRIEEEERILANVATGRRFGPVDTERLSKSGERLDVSLTISPVRDIHDKIVGAAKIARDVGEQRRAEAALRESQLRLRFILDAAQIGEWESDLLTGVVMRSLQHDRCFGYDALAPEWSPAIYMEHVHPEDRPEVSAKTQAIMHDRSEWHYQCRVVWPDGSIHWIRVNGMTIFDGDSPVRLVGIIADITEWKHYEESRLRTLRLEAENARVLEGSRVKSLFLANMSHELRTPLNAIIGFSDLLYQGSPSQDSPKYKEFLGHIRSSGRHLLQVVNDILDLSKVEAGKLEFVPEAVDLGALLHENASKMAATAQQKHIELVVDVADTPTAAHIDPVRFNQVVLNYLSNAVKFTADGGRVTVRLRPDGGGRFRVEVEDTGIGIAKEDIPRLFAEFEQLDSGLTKRHQGTGLGLALTRRLVQAQGGLVGLTSEVGKGSIFYFVLGYGSVATPANQGESSYRVG